VSSGSRGEGGVSQGAGRSAGGGTRLGDPASARRVPVPDPASARDSRLSAASFRRGPSRAWLVHALRHVTGQVAVSHACHVILARVHSVVQTHTLKSLHLVCYGAIGIGIR